MRIEVVWSPAPRCIEQRMLELADGSTVADAARAAGVPPGWVACGVWGRHQDEEHRLRDGDRVELYRPLRVDPKEARRQRYRGKGAAPKKERPDKAGR